MEEDVGESKEFRDCRHKLIESESSVILKIVLVNFRTFAVHEGKASIRFMPN